MLTILKDKQAFEPSVNLPPFSLLPIPDRGISTRSGSGLRSGLTPGGNSLRSAPLGLGLQSEPGEMNEPFGDEQHLRGAFPAQYGSNFRSDLTPQGVRSTFPQSSSNSMTSSEALVNQASLPTILDPHSTITNAVAPARNQLSRKRGHESLKNPYGIL